VNDDWAMFDSDSAIVDREIADTIREIVQRHSPNNHSVDNQSFVNAVSHATFPRAAIGIGSTDWPSSNHA
jgi:hypothetical protein